jgi:hypothetical protein
LTALQPCPSTVYCGRGPRCGGANAVIQAGGTVEPCSLMGIANFGARLRGAEQYPQQSRICRRHQGRLHPCRRHQFLYPLARVCTGGARRQSDIATSGWWIRRPPCHHSEVGGDCSITLALIAVLLYGFATVCWFWPDYSRNCRWNRFCALSVGSAVQRPGRDRVRAAIWRVGHEGVL